jgi:hypothetical protein
MATLTTATDAPPPPTVTADGADSQRRQGESS